MAFMSRTREKELDMYEAMNFTYLREYRRS